MKIKKCNDVVKFEKRFSDTLMHQLSVRRLTQFTIGKKLLTTFDQRHTRTFSFLTLETIYIYIRIDRIFCSVHEEITSIRLYTPRSGLCKGVYNLNEVISNEPNK